VSHAAYLHRYTRLQAGAAPRRSAQPRPDAPRSSWWKATKKVAAGLVTTHRRPGASTAVDELVAPSGMDGLLIVGRSGKPIVLSRFRHSRPVYPLLHADYLRDLVATIQANPHAMPLGEDAGVMASDRDLPPILPVPVADAAWEEGTEDTSDEHDSDTTDAPSLPAEATEWSEAARPRSPSGSEELEGGSVLCHIRVGELRFLCPVSRESTLDTLTQSTHLCPWPSCARSCMCCKSTWSAARTRSC